VTLPSGYSGSASYNFILASGSGYGANDPSLTWADSRTLSVSGMRAWEGKLIRV
jgi:hypothetical protein